MTHYIHIKKPTFLKGDFLAKDTILKVDNLTDGHTALLGTKKAVKLKDKAEADRLQKQIDKAAEKAAKEAEKAAKAATADQTPAE